MGMGNTHKSRYFANPGYNQPKDETKRLNHWVICPKDANGMANSEDPDQTAPLVAV